MIECEIIGGPKDGIWIALENAARPFRVAVPVVDFLRYISETTNPKSIVEPSYRVVEMYPELTANGWVLRWKEPT